MNSTPGALQPATDRSEAEINPTPHAELTVDEVAQLLRVDRKTVYGAASRGEIPGCRRLGTVIRFSRDAVLNWLAEGQGRAPGSRSNR